MTAEQLAAIPAELKACNNWVCWKYETKPGDTKPGKVPYNARSGYRATTTKPETFSSFADAVKAATTGRARDGHGYDGIGFAFTESPFFGVDLDHVGEAISRADAAAIVDALQTYAERSPSGQGVHLYARGSLPGAAVKNSGAGVEMYETGRFFTVTGDRLPGTAATVNDCTESIKPVYQRYAIRPAQQPAQTVRTEAAAATSGSGLPDAAILAKAMQNSRFAALWAGDMSEYDDDHSRADNALCYLLAFWCGHDLAQIDRLFRQSGLMRPKWDSRRGGSTYGADTISRAAAAQPDNYGDRRQLDTAAAERAAMPGGDQSGGSSVRTEAQPAQPISFESTADYIRRKGFAEHLQDSAQDGELVTGFAQLDALMCGWHCGIHVLGGTPGSGKTALALQMCDQISAAGRDCIYFSLEVPAGDMLARSLSRLTIQRLDALPCGEPDPRFDPVTYSALDILRGRAADQLDSLQADYLRNVGGRVHIIDRKLTTAEICSTVRQYVQQTGRKPVIFCDYLQLIAQISAAAQQDAKAATDTAIEAFTQLAKDLQLHIFVISSLNRMGYDQPADLTLFKESGAVEYSAVSAMILQLAAVYDRKPKTDKNGNPTSATRAPTTAELDEERQRQPRRLDLAILKSRYGKGAGSHLRLEYYSKCDYFIEQAQDCAHSTAAAELAADQSGAGGDDEECRTE